MTLNVNQSINQSHIIVAYISLSSRLPLGDPLKKVS